MKESIKYEELLQDRKPIFLSGDLPITINWLDKIDKEKLEKGILSCKYYNLSGVEYSLKTVNNKLEMKFYEYEVYDISLDMIIEFGAERNYDLIKSVYYWLLTESIKIKVKSDMVGENLKDIKEFGIRCINNRSKEISDVQSLINYLKNVEELDVSFLINTTIFFPDAYINGPFSEISIEDSPHHLTEMEILIERVIRENNKFLD